MKQTILAVVVLSFFALPFLLIATEKPEVQKDSSVTVSQFTETDFVLLGKVGQKMTPDILDSGYDITASLIQSLQPNAEDQAVVQIPVQRGGTRAALPIAENKSAKPAAQTGLENVPEEVDGLRLTDAERSVIAITNAERAKRGIKPLYPDRQLMESARRQAAWMAVTGIFRHSAVRAAENIAMGQNSSSAAMRSWMNSDGHRRNLLGSSYARIGVGAYRSSGGQMYWCQQFIR